MAKLFYDPEKLTAEEREQMANLCAKCEISESEHIEISVSEYIKNGQQTPADKLGGKQV